MNMRNVHFFRKTPPEVLDFIQTASRTHFLPREIAQFACDYWALETGIKASIAAATVARYIRLYRWRTRKESKEAIRIRGNPRRYKEMIFRQEGCRFPYSDLSEANRQRLTKEYAYAIKRRARIAHSKISQYAKSIGFPSNRVLPQISIEALEKEAWRAFNKGLHSYDSTTNTPFLNYIYIKIGYGLLNFIKSRLRKRLRKRKKKKVKPTFTIEERRKRYARKMLGLPMGATESKAREILERAGAFPRQIRIALQYMEGTRLLAIAKVTPKMKIKSKNPKMKITRKNISKERVRQIIGETKIIVETYFSQEKAA